jgi:hypothetical protein
MLNLQRHSDYLSSETKRASWLATRISIGAGAAVRFFGACGGVGFTVCEGHGLLSP